MNNLITILKVLNLYTHNLHNITKGSTFFQDHEFLGDIYDQYESDYDDCVERAIGLGQNLDLAKIAKDSGEATAKLPHTGDYWQMIIKMENALREEISKVYAGSSIGTQQLIGEIANKSEIRTYKLKQRVKS